MALSSVTSLAKHLQSMSRASADAHLGRLANEVF